MNMRGRGIIIGCSSVGFQGLKALSWQVDAGGGPSRSPRVSKGFCGDAREPSHFFSSC